MEQTNKIFCLTQHHYGYPMVLEARKMVQAGKLGKIRKVVVEYPQAWLATRIEAKGQKQASWRTNPRSTAASCCMSDVASIAYDLAATITGLQAAEVSADTTTFVNGRMLDDDSSILLRYEDGARGIIWATQVAIGEKQALKIRVYGENGSLKWQQSEPHTLKFWPLDGDLEIKSSEPMDIKETVSLADDIPLGHPDSSIEPLVNIYNKFSEMLVKIIDGKKFKTDELLFPGIPEGIQSAKFTEAALTNAASDEKWTALKEDI
jgi:predicted dehydrogenase